MSGEGNVNSANSSPVINGNSDNHYNSEPQIDQQTSEEQTEREISQTDHLNRRLLGAFLDRLNHSEIESGTFGVSVPVSQPAIDTSTSLSTNPETDQEFECDSSDNQDQLVDKSR